MTLSQADIDSLLGPQSAGSVESLLDTKLSGEDIANALQDPNFTPTQEQYQLFEDYNKTRQTDWLQSLLTAADTVVQTAGAAGKAALTTGAAFNPKNYVEGLAQGTAQLYGLVAQSQDPDSALFKLNNLISGTGTLENRYGQFLEARQFNKDLDAYAKGDMSIMFKPEDLNPEFVQGVAMVADPTMFVPGVGQLLGAEKVAAKALGKAVGVAGKGVQAISKPVERLSAATGRFVTEATGISPEALRGAATTSGVLAATGVGPAIGAVGAVPFIAEAATDVGRALESAGAQMGMTPTRIGALEAVGAIPEANMRQRIIGTIGRYGGDAALRTALAGTAGSQSPFGRRQVADRKYGESYKNIGNSNNPNAGRIFVGAMNGVGPLKRYDSKSRFRGRILYAAYAENNGKALDATMKAIAKTAALLKSRSTVRKAA